MEQEKNEKITFYHFQVNLEINQEFGIHQLNQAGVFGVECILTKRLFFMGPENSLYEISLFFNKLLKGSIRI